MNRGDGDGIDNIEYNLVSGLIEPYVATSSLLDVMFLADREDNQELFIEELQFAMNHRNNWKHYPVLTSQYVSAYRGQLVIRYSSNGRAGSFGDYMIFPRRSNMGHSRSVEVLRHEHGHFLQYQQLTSDQYYIGIGIPSFRSGGKGLSSKVYYSRPWEITADLLARIPRDFNHSQEDIDRGWRYFEYIKTLTGAALNRHMTWALSFDVHDPEFPFLD